LFALFLSRLEYGLLNFALFFSSLLGKTEIVLGHHSLVFVCHLVVIDFLLNTVLITLLKCKDLIGTFLGVVNFFPCLIFFLLKQGDTICQKLSITLNVFTTTFDFSQALSLRL